MLDVAELVIGELYAGYAGLVYWRLRSGSELRAEIAETRSWVRCTPPFHLFACCAGARNAADRGAYIPDQWPAVACRDGHPAVALLAGRFTGRAEMTPSSRVPLPPGPRSRQDRELLDAGELAGHLVPEGSVFTCPFTGLARPLRLGSRCDTP